MQTDELAEEVAAKREIYNTKFKNIRQKLQWCQEILDQAAISHKRKQNEINALLNEHQKDDLQQSKPTFSDLNNNVRDMKALIFKLENDLKEIQEKEVKDESEAQNSRIVKEYEISISKIVAENEKLKKQRDTAQMHLVNVEMAFTDVNQKYERYKNIIQGYKDNEEAFRKDIDMTRGILDIQEKKYAALKAHALDEMQKFNEQLAKMKKYHEICISRLIASVKNFETKNISIMELLQQKTKESEKLSKVCDKYIGNVRKLSTCSEH